MNFYDWMQGRSSDDVLAEQRAWIICPPPVEMLLAEHGTQLWFNGQVIPISSVNFGEDVALISDGTPVVIHVAKGHGVFPWHEIYNPDGVEAHRQAIYENELAAIHDEKPSRYALKELIMHACNRGIDITAAQAALGGREDVLCAAIAALKETMEPAAEIPIAIRPWNEGEQANQDVVTAEYFTALATRGSREIEEIEPPKLPEPEFVELMTPEECHAQFQQDILDRSLNKWHRGMFECRCNHPLCPHKNGFKPNYAWKNLPEHFVKSEEASAQMRAFSDAANKNWKELEAKK